MIALVVVTLVALWATINAVVFIGTRESVQRISPNEYRPFHWTVLVGPFAYYPWLNRLERRAYKWGPGVSLRADTQPPEVLMEVRDNRQDRNLLRAWDASGRELSEAERVLVGKPAGMGTGTCGNPTHASQHPPHVAQDEVLGEYWCVGGWVRTDGTIPRRP